MTEIGALQLTLTARQRFWFRPALRVLILACFAASTVSMHAANWMSGKGCAFLARYGVKIEAV